MFAHKAFAFSANHQYIKAINVQFAMLLNVISCHMGVVRLAFLFVFSCLCMSRR